MWNPAIERNYSSLRQFAVVDYAHLDCILDTIKIEQLRDQMAFSINLYEKVTVAWLGLVELVPSFLSAGISVNLRRHFPLWFVVVAHHYCFSCHCLNSHQQIRVIDVCSVYLNDNNKGHWPYHINIHYG